MTCKYACRKGPEKWQFKVAVGCDLPRGVLGAPQRWDGPAFAAWLHRWMDANDILVVDLARRSGLSKGQIQDLRRGTTRPSATKGSTRGVRNVNVNTLAAIADGLGLRFSYVASKAGLTDEGDRWAAFSPAERAILAERLGGDPNNLDAIIQKQEVA